MGKRLIQQRRGSSPQYKTVGFRFKGDARHPAYDAHNTKSFTIIDLVHCPGHTAPLALVETDGQKKHILAPLGAKVGDVFQAGAQANPTSGNVLPLSSLPEGAQIHNIELRPGDGGKLVRGAGSSATLVVKTDTHAVIQLPSRKKKSILLSCRAAVGTVAGGGRADKPLLKAGANYHKKKARRRLYPIVSGVSMNAVDHPFGSKGSHTKGKPTQSARNDPPGRKVGKIAPSRTGRKRR